jgi:uncharacterized membrane protein YdbT with pleckstrin-like domain
MPKQLLTGESLALPPIHRHWILIVRGLFPVTTIAIIFLLLVNVAMGGLLPGEFRLVLSLAMVAIVGLVGIVVWLRWLEDSLTVTDQRVILEEGVFRRISRVIPLDRIQDVSTTQTLPGRVLGYGTVKIEAAGTSGGEQFAYVSAPEQLRDQVFLLTERRRQEA